MLTEPRGILPAIASWCARRPVLALLAWVLLLGVAVSTAVVGVTGEGLFERLKSEAPSVESESSRADDLLSGEDNSSTVTLLIHGVELDDAALTAFRADLESRLDFPRVSVLDPLAVPQLPDGSRIPAVEPLVASDDRGVLFVATIDGTATRSPTDAEEEAVVTALAEARDELREEFPDATVEIGSTTLLVDSIVAISENDLQRGETIALPIALVIMLLVFGGFLAAGIPLFGAIAAIVGALGALFGFTYIMDIDTTVVNVITAVGLGLSIDYGLLMVSRFREEYRSGLLANPNAERRSARLAAIVRTADTAGRTVFFSGTIFAIATISLLVFEARLVRAVGIGALAVTVIALASALTLVPALLAVSGDRLIRPGLITRIPLLGKALTRFGDVAPEEGFFSRLTRAVQKQPALVTIASALVLVVLAAPALSLRLANTSADTLPSSSTQYPFVSTIDDHFALAASPRVALVTESEDEALRWAESVESVAGVKSVGTPVELGDGWRSVVSVVPTDGVDVVRAIRADRPDFAASVTGVDARTIDFSESLLERAPLAILVIALGTITLLFLMTGSLVIPIKALLASGVSLGASIGILVWGFQFGNFAGVLGFDPAEILGIDVLVLVLVIAFGFGLAMDYEMFILSRIKEAVDGGASTREAIPRGLQRSGRIISSAGLIIVVVFAGFATGDLMVIKQLGVALAVAVVLDATLVRCLLVPAFMTWQQGIMWWAPRWMKRLHGRLGLRGD